MEFWIIFTKLLLLVYIATLAVQTNISNISWVVLAFLVYFCVNITLYICKNNNLKRVLHVLSIGITTAAYLVVDPLFSLLLPISMVELSAGFIGKKVTLLLISLLPILYMDEALQPIYGLVAVLSFMMFALRPSMVIN